MQISELFYSIQGEGSLVGVPSVFIRTSGCNLRCNWCDTPYSSWAPEGTDVSVSDVVDKAKSFACSHVVVTGGEPLISPQIAELTRELRRNGHHITIETAGTVYADVACDLMSVSPKLANSTPWDREAGKWARMHERTRIQPNVLKRLITSYDYQLKFVVQEPEDMTEVEDIVKTIDADRSRVILMPEGTDPSAVRDRGRWLAELCKQEGYRLSPRLHVDLWGDRRGV